jgi:outer membrane protein, heavy metal efflux system
MRVRTKVGLVMVATLVSTAAAAQPPASPSAARHVDPVKGLSLDQAIALALEQEPSLRAARSQIDVARGMREQSSLRPNPTVSFERREEPQGPDNQTMLSLEWPLDLFRRDARVAVADRQVAAAELAVADRRRLLVAAVRARYGEVLTALRDLGLFDDLVAASERQHNLLRARVDEGATAPLDRDLVAVDLRRLESERLLQTGRVEVTLVELKRVLGMQPGATLMVRDTLEDVVLRESAAAPLPAAEVTSIIEQRVDVRESAAQVEIAGAKIGRAEHESRFDVNLFASYSRMNSGFPQLGVAPTGGLTPIRSVFHYVAAGAMVTVPLRNRNQGELAAARAEQSGAALTHEAARLTAQTELAAARTRDDYARQAVKIYGGAQGLARQNLAVVDQSFQLGRVTVFDVLSERRRYIEVERGYTDALRAAFEARTALNQASGEGR